MNKSYSAVGDVNSSIKSSFRKKVFSLDLKVVRVAADLQVSGSLFQIFDNTPNQILTFLYP